MLIVCEYFSSPFVFKIMNTMTNVLDTVNYRSKVPVSLDDNEVIRFLDQLNAPSSSSE